MSRALRAGVASAWLAASASLVAANIWESKPFHTWTDEELEKVLTSSPWAGKGSITYVRTRSQPIQEEAIVTWVSSRVMRQALAREEFGPTPEIPTWAEATIARTPTVYIVTVKISKGATSANHARQAAVMQDETFLQLRGKPPIPAVQAEGEVIGQDGKPLAASEEPPTFRDRAASGGGLAVFASAAQRGGGGGGATRGDAPAGGQRSGGDGQGRGRAGRAGRGGVDGPVSTASLLTFRFPRDTITLDDKDVEFVTKLCGGGVAGPPTSLPDILQFNAAGAGQRGSGTTFPPDLGGILQGSAAAQAPACNYTVKKKFKLKDMVVKGKLEL